MSKYNISHFDASATREHMEQIVAAHGGIKVLDYTIASLSVEADADVVKSFQDKHPAWIVTQQDKAPVAKPAANASIMRLAC
ncbi:MAG: hypothetical protein ACK4NR_07920 [Micavibrio sp.]